MNEEKNKNYIAKLHKEILSLIENILSETSSGHVKSSDIIKKLRREIKNFPAKKLSEINNYEILELIKNKLKNQNFLNNIKKLNMYHKRLDDFESIENKLKKLYEEKYFFEMKYNSKLLNKLYHYQKLLEEIRVLENPTNTGPYPHLNASNQAIRERIEWNENEKGRQNRASEKAKKERNERIAKFKKREQEQKRANEKAKNRKPLASITQMF